MPTGIYVRTKLPLVERFWAKVNKLGPMHPKLKTRCWVWTAGVFGSMGYGLFAIHSKAHVAHRVAWFLKTGEWPSLCCLHKCDNVVCVRFGHLFLGTRTDNNNDRTAKGRSAKGENTRSAKLSVDAVKRIRIRLANGESQRHIAMDEGVTQGPIRDINLGITWRHVP